MLMPFRRREVADPFWGLDWMRDFFTDNWPTPMNLDFRADIKENENEYVIEAEMPGINKEQITVEFRDQTLSISAEHMDARDEETENYIRRERRKGSMSRSFYVEDINVDEIKASYEDGVLKVLLPKLTPDAPKNHQIPIE